MKNLIYGEAVKDWRGSGELQLGGGAFPCVFELVQAGSGRIALTCDVEGLAGFVAEDASLIGRVDGGQDALVSRCFVRSHQLKIEGDVQRTALTMLPREYEVRSGGGTSAAFRYGLTNVRLIGNDAYRLSDGSGGRQARFPLDGFDLVIREVKGSWELGNEAKATRGVAVTAHALVSATSEDRERLEETLRRVCLLLTLALGHRVEWIYREALDEQGSVLSTNGRNAVTKPWGGLQLIPDEAVCRFVETAYSGLVAALETWGLEKGILSYNDAKLEGDYLEFRALKMAVVMEYLKGRYLGGRRKVRFREAAAGMCGSLSVPLSEPDLGLLVKVRNSLVHEATFWKGKEAPSQFEQYVFFMTVIGRVLLATLRYQGEYYDWRGASDGNGPRKALLDSRAAS